MVARKGFNQSLPLVTTDVDARELFKALNKLPKDVQNGIRITNQTNAEKLRHEIIGEIGAGDPPQAELIKSTIKAKRDRNIRVDSGGVKQVGRAYASRTKAGRKYRAPAGALVFGAEYGSSGKPTDRKGRAMGARFVRPHNPKGYFIGPALVRFGPILLKEWIDTINQQIRKEGLR